METGEEREGGCWLSRVLQFEPVTQRYLRTSNVCIWAGVRWGQEEGATLYSTAMCFILVWVGGCGGCNSLYHYNMLHFGEQRVKTGE